MSDHHVGFCVFVMKHPPTESQGSEVASAADWAWFHGSSGGGGVLDEGPNMSTRSSMADYSRSRNPFCKSVPNTLRFVLREVFLDVCE